MRQRSPLRNAVEYCAAVLVLKSLEYAPLPVANVLELLLRQRERDEHRPHLGHHHQRRGVARAHQVADVDETRAQPPRDRRPDLGVFEVQLGGLDLRLIALDRRLELADRRPLLIEGLLGLEAAREEFAGAVEIELRALELRGVLGLGGLGLGERRLVRARVDLEQQRTGLDLLPFGEIDRDDRPVDAALDRDGVERLDRADAVQQHRHVLGGHHAEGDGNGRRRLLGRSGWRGAVARRPKAGAARRERDAEDEGDEARLHTASSATAIEKQTGMGGFIPHRPGAA